MGAVLDKRWLLEQAGVGVVTVPGNHDQLTYADSGCRERARGSPGVRVQNRVPQHVATLSVSDIADHVHSLACTGGLTPTQSPIAWFPGVDKAGFHRAAFQGTMDGSVL